MKISIITVCFNAQATIQETLNSVLAQNVTEMEHLIIDGASGDGTLELIEEYAKIAPFPVTIISEPDKGLYDAMNKGLNIAKGQYIHFLNADDQYVKNTTLAEVLPLLMKDKLNHGNIIFSEATTSILLGGETSKEKERRWPFRIHQPGMIVAREHYEKTGRFSLKYRIAADFDMTLRLLAFLQPFHLGENLVFMASGGLSDRNAALGYRECSIISSNHGRNKFLSFLDYLYLISKLKIKNRFTTPYCWIRNAVRRNSWEEE